MVSKIFDCSDAAESTRMDIDNLDDCFPDRTPHGHVIPVAAPQPVAVPKIERNKWYKPETLDDVNYSYRRIANSPVGLCLRGILLIIPVFMIYAGYANMEHCPLRKEIPIWSIVIGALWIVKSFKFFIFRESSGQNHYSWRFIILLYTYALFIGFICGSALVFGKITYWTYKEVDSPTYCNPTVFIPAIISISFIYIVMLGILFVFRYTYIGDNDDNEQPA